jgi:hypothetical protein
VVTIGPAADVEDVVAEPDFAGPVQDLVLPPQLSVVTSAGNLNAVTNLRT